jgi:hypothetical protein
MTPKRLTSMIFWKYEGSANVPLRPMPALRARRSIWPSVQCKLGDFVAIALFLLYTLVFNKLTSMRLQKEGERKKEPQIEILLNGLFQAIPLLQLPHIHSIHARALPDALLRELQVLLVDIYDGNTHAIAMTFLAKASPMPDAPPVISVVLPGLKTAAMTMGCGGVLVRIC